MYRIAVNTDDVLVDTKMVAEMVEKVEVQGAIPGGNRIWAVGRKVDEEVVAKVDDFARKTANLRPVEIFGVVLCPDSRRKHAQWAEKWFRKWSQKWTQNAS